MNLYAGTLRISLCACLYFYSHCTHGTMKRTSLMVNCCLFYPFSLAQILLLICWIIPMRACGTLLFTGQSLSMEHTSHINGTSGRRQNGYTQNSTEMATIGVLLKAWGGFFIGLIFLAISQATAQQWALYASIAAGLATFGYTMYKWIRDIISDFKSGKRTIRRPRKKWKHYLRYYFSRWVAQK